MKLMEYHKFQIFFCREQDIYDDVDYADGKFPFLYSALKSSQTELLSFVIEVQV